MNSLNIEFLIKKRNKTFKDKNQLIKQNYEKTE
jgi:hypothetical protein